MAHAGLSGRAFIPLLSSFACAVPGIMATRTIDDPKDRLTTILVAPLMTCSARLPVYTLDHRRLHSRPQRRPRHRPAGAGPVRPLRVRRRRRLARRARAAPTGGQGRRRQLHDGAAQISDAAPGRCRHRPLAARADLPEARRRPSSLAPPSCCGRWPASRRPAPGEKQVDVSIAGHIGRRHPRPSSRPIGFNQDIALALLPAMAAREVAVAAIGTVYALDATDDQALTSLEDQPRQPLVAGHRSGLPHLVRLRPAMHLDHRRHPARDQRLEMAALHGRLSVRSGLCRCRRDLLDGGRFRPRLERFAAPRPNANQKDGE